MISEKNKHTNIQCSTVAATEFKNYYLIWKKKLFNFGSLRPNPCVRVTQGFKYYYLCSFTTFTALYSFFQMQITDPPSSVSGNSCETDDSEQYVSDSDFHQQNTNCKIFLDFELCS
jgi:hypothetical protein